MRNEKKSTFYNLKSKLDMRDNILLNKSKALALRVIRMYNYLCDEKKEFVLSKQVLRSGTSIGANIREANRSQSKKEFIAKLNISLKEADETMYWLELLHESEYLDNNTFNSIYTDTEELVKLLVSIIKSTKSNLNS